MKPQREPYGEGRNKQAAEPTQEDELTEAQAKAKRIFDEGIAAMKKIFEEMERKAEELPVKVRMNPLPELCEDFLEMYHGSYRTELLDRIANCIMGFDVGMDAPEPTTAKALRNRIDGLLINAGKLEKAQKRLMPMDAEDHGAESLEELAYYLED